MNDELNKLQDAIQRADPLLGVYLDDGNLAVSVRDNDLQSLLAAARAHLKYREEQPAATSQEAASSVSPLLPCPFCASHRIIKGARYFAMCVDCGATGPERIGDKAGIKKLFADWNSRVATQDEGAPPAGEPGNILNQPSSPS